MSFCAAWTTASAIRWSCAAIRCWACPGLVDAIVAGNVKVANALGSGVIETAAIMPFLPGLARHLLGEQLKLPSVATWWCGQEYALDWVLNHLDSVVVKPAFPSRGMEPVFGSELPQTEKGKFAKQLRARPHEYVAQEQVALSTAPVWENGCLNSRSVVLRTYVLNTGEWMGGDSRRAGARGGGGRVGGLDAARRPQQRRLGALGWACRHLQHAAAAQRAGGAAPRCRAWCRAALPIIFSGWAVMWSARRTRRAFCARSIPRVRRAEEPELACLRSPARLPGLASQQAAERRRRPGDRRELEKELHLAA